MPNPPPRFLFRAPVFHLALAGLSLVLARPGRAQSAASETPIQLPEFVVEAERDLPPPEVWRYAKISGFEILANSTDRETKTLVRDFQIFQRALSVVWPDAQQDTGATVSLILCGSKDRFKDFRPAGKAGETRADAALASLFFKKQEQGAIVLDLQSSSAAIVSHESLAMLADVELEDDARRGANSASDFRIDHQKQLQREYIRYLVSNGPTRAPAWFEEGLAQIFMRMRIGKKEIAIGELSDEPPQVPLTASTMMLAGLNPRGAVMAPEQQAAREMRQAQQQLEGYTEKDFNQALQHRQLIPWQEFFTVEHGSATALNPLGSRWAKQAQAFVHLCLYARDKRHQKGFLTFIARLQREPVSEALFQECFKVSYAKMMDELYAYVRTTAHKVYTYKLTSGTMEDPPLIQLREASEAEIGRIKGTALGLADHREKARLTLIAAYRRGAREPEMLAALGLAESAAGDKDRAEKFLEAASAGKAASTRAYVELARLRLDRFTRSEPRQKLSPPQVGAVLEPLFAARTKSPPLRELYHLIAQAWRESREAPTREHLTVLIEGVNRFPWDTELITHAARLHLDHGFKAQGDELMEFSRNRGK